ncbi:MAG: BREX system Lon protease-like protein BrxL [Saprospirales bacterium]|nr:MAG: BREX system Lon protease-like protein BrxL [Saprospirales bacterium]
MTTAKDELNIKANNLFGGKVVRKDLTKLIKGNAVVPTYVLEYLLGQYCASDDTDTINHGMELVKKILSSHYVHRDEAKLIQSKIREKGSHTVIDKVEAHLNDNEDRYELNFLNLGLKKVPVGDEIINENQKLLTNGVWCIINVGYVVIDDKKVKPWVVESLKPIQISSVNIEEFKEARKAFSREEWIDLLMHTIGLDPEEFSFRNKLLQLCRLVPFVENNYNIMELGPKGTGKSHIYSELSPHGILISGGEVTKAKLFINNNTKDIGLVGHWDVVAYDEFAGKKKSVDRGLVDIMKNYMANKTFSRGTDVLTASASMAFVGNTDHPVEYMMNHSSLFDSLPDTYKDSAFLDRMHAYLPGWEVEKLRTQMFSDQYGFIVDYLAEILRFLRKEDFSILARSHFELNSELTTRDRTAVHKTLSGLLKIIHPDGQFTREELLELLEFSMELRKRIQNQLARLDQTFEELKFQYAPGQSKEFKEIELLEDINFGKKKKRSQPVKSEGELKETPKEAKESSLLEQADIKVEETKEGQVKIRDNQIGVTYEDLFGPYLRGGTTIEIADPYIRLPYQMRNLMELMKVISDHKPLDEIVTVKLKTYYSEGFKEKAEENFCLIAESLLQEGIHFTWQFDEFLHDRYIESNNGWKIIPGRGLDIYQKGTNYWDLSELDQSRRKCRACEVSYLRVG